RSASKLPSSNTSVSLSLKVCSIGPSSYLSIYLLFQEKMLIRTSSRTNSFTTLIRAFLLLRYKQYWTSKRTQPNSIYRQRVPLPWQTPLLWHQVIPAQTLARCPCRMREHHHF